MKIIILAVLAAVFCAATTVHAGITGTNLVPLATYSAGTNAGVAYAPSQSHVITPQSYTIYHSATNSAFPTTVYMETTFDGGATWAIVATNQMGTNLLTETWNPSTSAIAAQTRIRVVTTTNQQIYVNANWNQ